MSISAISAGMLRVSCASWSRRIRFFRSATSVPTIAVLAEEMSARIAPPFRLDFRPPSADDNFALKRVWCLISRLMLGHRFGASRRPFGTRSSASHCAPL
jgi:hypothetical protein